LLLLWFYNTCGLVKRRTEQGTLKPLTEGMLGTVVRVTSSSSSGVERLGVAGGAVGV
jgi:hypothetical protein